MNSFLIHGARWAAPLLLLTLLSPGVSVGQPATDGTASDIPPTLDEETLVRWVLAANPGVFASEAAAEAAAYRIDPAGSLDDPMLGYGAAPRTADADQGLNQRLDISQKFPWPGTLAAREAVARDEALAMEKDADAVRLRIAAQSKAALAEWRFVEAALAIHHTTRDLLDQLIGVAQTRYASGNALRQDVLQAEVERAALDNHLLVLEREKTTVQARINALLNRPPSAPLPPAAPMTLSAAPPSLSELETLALRRHPELMRIEAQIAAAESRQTLAEKAFYPDFQVGIGYNSLWDEHDKRPTLGVSINLPLDRGKRRAELGRARAATRQAEWTLQERRADLLASLAQALAEVEASRLSVILYQDRLVPLAGDYLEAAIADYQSGSGAFLNVVNAEQRKLNTDLALARARADYLRHRAMLERWIGGPTDTESASVIGNQP